MNRSIEVNYRMTDREIRETFIIDTNRINSRNSLPNMNRLEKWRRDGVIYLHISDIARAEAKAGRNDKRTQKTLGYVFTLSFEKEPRAQQMLAQVKQILGCRSQNDLNDARIVCNAWWCEAILITDDKNILGKCDELRTYGIRVMTDFEAVIYVQSRIRERDAEILEDSKWTGEPLPEWYGRD